MTVTMKDIAKAAGVSRAAVSYVINDKPGVSEETRQRILAAMSELNYQRNRMAAGLRKKRSSMVAYVVPNIINPIFAQVARGIQDVMLKVNHSVILCNTDLQPEKFRAYQKDLIESRIDGLILSAAHDPVVKPFIAAFAQARIPVVIVHSPRDQSEIDTLLIDDAQCAAIAVRHLIALGHRRIGAIGAVRSTTTDIRLEAVERVLEESGIPFDDRLVYLGESYARECGYEGCRKLLQLNPRPTAVFALTDSLGVGALGAALDAGLAIPGEISIVSFDNTLAQYTKPRLTTIDTPNYLLGQEAAKLLLEHLDNPEKHEAQKSIKRLFPGELVIGGTTGRFPL